jgi:Family of unknown function (DUF5678)
MAQTSKAVEFDSDLFIRNRNKWTYEELLPYLGHWVAWNLDGKSIVAHYDTLKEVIDACEVLGLQGEDYLLGCLPSREELEGYS